MLTNATLRRVEWVFSPPIDTPVKALAVHNMSLYLHSYANEKLDSSRLAIVSKKKEKEKSNQINGAA